MADELIENAVFGKKNKDEEAPILIAQRFLNIFRQIHIFNHERQEQFDDMLMNITPEVRILLSTLPGGGLLLEHIAETEQKRGVISPYSPKPITARKKETISDTQISPEHRENYSSGGGGVIIDASFASELSSSLSMALQQNEKRYKEDMQTLTQTITHSIMESQTAMVSMMRDILIATKASNAAINSATHNNIIMQPQVKTPETKPVVDNKPQVKVPETKSDNTYKNELNKIKSALQNNNQTDLNTLISLDDFDDEPISLDDIDDNFSFNSNKSTENNVLTPQDITASSEDEDWEWEYVDGDDTDGDEWEWEYVDEESDDW